MAADLTNIEKDVNSIAGNSANFTSDISTMLSVLQRMDTSISTNKRNTKGAAINTSGITTMLKAVNAVNPKFQTLSSNLTDVNNAFTTLSNTLLKFNQSILSGQIRTNTPSGSGTTRNALNTPTQFSSIEKALEGIYDKLSEFHKDFIDGKGGSNIEDEKLKNDIRKQNEKEARERLAYRKAIWKEEHGQKLSKKDKEAIKTHEEVEKRRKKPPKKQVLGNALNGAASAFGTFMGGNIDVSSMINTGIGMISKLTPWGAVLSIFKAVADTVDKEQGFGRDYTRAHGGDRYGMNQFMRQSQNFRLGQKTTYGFTAEDYFKAASDISNATGRQAYRQTNGNIASSIMLKRMGIEGDYLGMFDTFGTSVQRTDKYFTELYGKAGKTGISFKKMTEAIKNNLKMAQTYTFSEGINGLQKMAETSTRLKYNMSEVAKFAEKVNTVEGAIRTSASLSVLGGDFAQFSNPMGLLYESLNDMEGLNERMVEMFSKFAKWNSSKGQIEIDSFDRERIKRAAEAMGVDANEMMNISMNKARENRIENQAKQNGIKDTELLEYLKNLAQLDSKGNAYIADEEGNPVFFDKINESMKSLLKKESEAKSAADKANLGDIYTTTRTIYDFLNDNLKGVSGKLGAITAKYLGGSGIERTKAQNDYIASLSEKQKQEYYKQYGRGGWLNRDKFIKRAIENGELTEATNDYYGGKEREDYYSKNVDKYVRSNRNAIIEYDDLGNSYILNEDVLKQEFLKKLKNGDFDKEIKEEAKKKNETNHVGTAGVHGEHLRILQNNESVLTGDATRRLGVRNVQRLNSGDDPFANIVRNVINEKFDYLKSVSVAPTKNQSGWAGGGTSKIAFEPLTLNLTGQFNLVSPNGRFRNIPLDDIDTRALKKVILDTVTENIPTIMRKTSILNKRGYDMENDPYRGAMQVPYV